MIPRECKISDEQVGDLVIWEVKGDVARRSEPAFEEAYRQLETTTSKKILFQFEPRAYFNSEGIKVLIQLIAKTKRNQQVVGITGLSGHSKKIFGMVGITKLAKLYDSREEAIEALSVSANEKS
jgi:anti-anti-sigma factor